MSGRGDIMQMKKNVETEEMARACDWHNRVQLISDKEAMKNECFICLLA